MARIIPIIVAIPLLYVLSYGPALRICIQSQREAVWSGEAIPQLSLEPPGPYNERARRRFEALVVIYAPLDWLNARSHIFSEALEWYLKIWAPTG